MASNDEDEQGPAPRDASFSDSYEPARLAARDEQDLQVISALLQDAVAKSGDLGWLPRERRFAFVANRYRWEDPDARERVRVGVHFDNVLSAKVKGLDAQDKERPLQVLTITFEPAAEPPGGLIRIACAGEVEAVLEVEAIEAALRDLSQPWSARVKPRH